MTSPPEHIAVPALPPGSTIGILGGGQLGRMTALAAARLGYHCHVFSPDADAPAKEVAAFATTAPYEDQDAARNFSASVHVVTFEFENVPDDVLTLIAQQVQVRPGIRALRISQDRIAEKSFLNSLGIATTSWRPVDSSKALASALGAIGTPAILKTARFGYDGHGQTRLQHAEDGAKAWHAIGRDRSILERVVDFEREISVIVARGIDGSTVNWPPVDNVHSDHILRTTTAPSSLPPVLCRQAVEIAAKIAKELEIIGLVAVEMFVTRGGGILVNEIAPRPHNSGHWTIDACAVNQFEQLVRAVTGLPLGDPTPHSSAVMTNLIGDEVDAWPLLVLEPSACLHIYGKSVVRAGRKMGHVTRLSPALSGP